MRWRGPAGPAALAGRLPGLTDAACRPPGPGTRTRDRSPGSSHVPGVAPRWYPFPNGEDISTASAGAAQEPGASHFRFSVIHDGIHRKRLVIRIVRWLSTGLFTVYPQARLWHCGTASLFDGAARSLALKSLLPACLPNLRLSCARQSRR